MFIRPITIPKHIRNIWATESEMAEVVAARVAANYGSMRSNKPEVSVVIPAFNEEKNIVRTLLSLASNITTRAVEIIVVNNNSVDDTEKLVRACGVTCVNESRQGITAARNAGLAAARGTYILNADADSIYPRYWIEDMVAPLTDGSSVAITYGIFGFIPTQGASRFGYFLYEQMTDKIRRINKYFREEAVNVYGFNSGFRRLQGMEVNGFDHPPGANEDGWLAVKLREKGFGKIHCVSRRRAMVWTSDRRIQADGGLLRGILLRLKKLFFPAKDVVIRKDL